MDLKRIGAFCKRKKRVSIVYGPKNGDLWVGDGTGMWLADAGVEINRENAAALLDIDGETMDGITVNEGDSDLAIWNGDGVYGEEERALVAMCLVVKNEMKLALIKKGENRVALIDWDYAKAAVKSENYRQYWLIGDEDDPVVAVGDGVMVKMLVKPEDYRTTRKAIWMCGEMGKWTPYGEPEDEQTEMEM